MKQKFWKLDRPAIRLSDGKGVSKGDWVEHVDNAPGQAAKVDEVFETGHLIEVWPNGQRWVQEARFLTKSSKTETWGWRK